MNRISSANFQSRLFTLSVSASEMMTIFCKISSRVWLKFHWRFQCEFQCMVSHNKWPNRWCVRRIFYETNDHCAWIYASLTLRRDEWWHLVNTRFWWPLFVWGEWEHLKIEFWSVCFESCRRLTNVRKSIDFAEKYCWIERAPDFCISPKICYLPQPQHT